MHRRQGERATSGQNNLPVGARGDKDNRRQKGEDNRPEGGEGHVVSRHRPVGPGMGEGIGELVPAGVPLAVADVLQDPEPARAWRNGAVILEPKYSQGNEDRIEGNATCYPTWMCSGDARRGGSPRI